ncbi:MAG TPA: hypothetical protein VJV78_32465 [Polyangiales bacterium]|nr:hypothetical protein [Polyangiales bacterium]
MNRPWIHWAFSALLFGLQGCGEQTELQVSTPDGMQFAAEVYPILLRDCAFHACHGSTERFLQVFGPGRGRMLATTPPLDPATPGELLHSYNRARSMLDAVNPERSLLLRKPLATAAGGTGHEGVDALGRNVYQSTEEVGYRALAQWVRGTPAQSTATGAMR